MSRAVLRSARRVPDTALHCTALTMTWPGAPLCPLTLTLSVCLCCHTYSTVSALASHIPSNPTPFYPTHQSQPHPHPIAPRCRLSVLSNMQHTTLYYPIQHTRFSRTGSVQRVESNQIQSNDKLR